MPFESEPNEAYFDRNLCVQVMARMAQKLGYNMGIKENGEWPILYIDLPTGQVSWHISKPDLKGIFQTYLEDWDGHDVEIKRMRLLEYIKNEEVEK